MDALKAQCALSLFVFTNSCEKYLGQVREMRPIKEHLNQPQKNRSRKRLNRSAEQLDLSLRFPLLFSYMLLCLGCVGTRPSIREPI